MCRRPILGPAGDCSRPSRGRQPGAAHAWRGRHLCYIGSASHRRSGHGKARGLSMRWVEHETLRTKPTLSGAGAKKYRIGIRAPSGS
eukprot:6728133-Alexandrium_andersonii.AAC.1